MTKSLRISEKHGINPMIPQCFFCGQDKNEIVLLGRLPGDAEAPKHGVIDHEPCDSCKEYMKQGIMVISVSDDATNDDDNPFRTGKLAVVKDKAIKELLDEEAYAEVNKKRCMFVNDSMWKQFFTPEEEEEGES